MAPSNATVDYEGLYTVTCEPGYTVADSVMMCDDPGTFNVTATCTAVPNVTLYIMNAGR